MSSPDKVASYPDVPGARRAVEDSVVDEMCVAMGIPKDASSELGRLATAMVEKVHERPERGFGMPGPQFQIGQIGWTMWAIRREQLDLFKQMGAAAAAVVAYLSVATASPAVLVVALAVAGFELARRLKAKGVILNENQRRVLLLLRQKGPTLVADLVTDVNGLRIAGSSLLDQSRVEVLLAELESIHAGDGTIEHLVVRTPAGVWSANGV